MSSKNFRGLILLYVLLLIADTAVSAFAPSYSQALSDALDNEPTPALLENPWLLLPIAVPLAGAALAGIFGLFLFKPWGRLLSLLSTIGGLIVFPFFGPSLSGGIESTLWEASTLVWGAILALAYYSPVAALFERAKPWPDSVVES
jgi:hypothetical protein